MAKKMVIYFTTSSIFFLFISCIEGMMYPLSTTMKPIFAAMIHLAPEQITVFFHDFLIKIHAHISLVGWVTAALMGVLYYTAYQVKGYDRYIKWVCLVNFWSHVGGVLIMVAGFHLIGYFGISAGLKHGTPEFNAVAGGYKAFVGIGGFLVICSVFCFSYNILRTLWSKEQ